MIKKRKIEMDRFGNKGWIFTIDDKKTYRTNGNGQGLWIWIEYKANWKQIKGTTQFSLPKPKKKAYNKIYYHFVK